MRFNLQRHPKFEAEDMHRKRFIFLIYNYKKCEKFWKDEKKSNEKEEKEEEHHFSTTQSPRKRRNIVEVKIGGGECEKILFFSLF